MVGVDKTQVGVGKGSGLRGCLRLGPAPTKADFQVYFTVNTNPNSDRPRIFSECSENFLGMKMY